jgi:hypothetical protein
MTTFCIAFYESYLSTLYFLWGREEKREMVEEGQTPTSQCAVPAG